MGASCKEDSLEVIKDSVAFAQRVGLVVFIKDLEPLGFDMAANVALFKENNIKDLNNFIARHPEYHLVSMVAPYVYRNKYLKGFNTYRIARGDANPNLLNHPYLNSSLALYHEELHQELATKFREIYRSHDGKPLFEDL